ncbi:MAG: peptide deformylase [Bacillota bacterium]|jgi:peptide deformylase
MAVRNILIYPHSTLSKPAVKVTKFHEQLHKVLDDMHETMLFAGGVGLAAPQIGILKAMVVIKHEEQQLELVNPVLTVKEGVQLEPLEGCLSLPDILARVKRYETITVQAQDRFGEKIEHNCTGFLARIVQHELDHLQGILIIDRTKEVYKRKNKQAAEESESKCK